MVLGLAAACVFPLLIALNIAYQKRIDRYFDAAQAELGSLSAAVHESFDGVTVVKAFGAEDRETERLSVIAARLREARIGTVRLRSLFEALLDGIPNVVNIALIVAGAYRVRSGDMLVGELTSFVYLFTLLVFPLRLIGFALSELPHSQSGWNRVREVLDQPVAADPTDRLIVGPDGSDIVLDEVRVGHEPDRDVLDGFTARVVRQDRRPRRRDRRGQDDAAPRRRRARRVAERVDHRAPWVSGRSCSRSRSCSPRTCARTSRSEPRTTTRRCSPRCGSPRRGPSSPTCPRVCRPNWGSGASA